GLRLVVGLLQHHRPVVPGRAPPRGRQDGERAPRLLGADDQRDLALEPHGRAALHSFSAVNRGSMCTPSASPMAFASAGGTPIAPLSPSPLAPSGFRGDGVSTNVFCTDGMSAAVGSA